MALHFDAVGGRPQGATRGWIVRAVIGAAAVVVVAAATITVVSRAASAAPPGLAVPGRVYPTVNQIMDFAGTDPISGDNRAITVSGLVDGPGGCDTSEANGYSIDDCPRLQIDLNTADAGLLRIPIAEVISDIDANPDVDVVVAVGGAIVDQSTDENGDDSLLFDLNGTSAQLADVLSAMQLVPCGQTDGTTPCPTTDYEEPDTEDGQLPTLSILAVQGDGGDNASASVRIKVEGTNDGPTITVPLAALDAPAGATSQYPDVAPAVGTPGVVDVRDPEVCNLTDCGAPFTDPGLRESDDEMLLVAWIPESQADPTVCGTFSLRGGAFTTMGGATLTSVHSMLTAAGGENLEDDQALAIEGSISPSALLLDLSTQAGGPTGNNRVFAGIGTRNEIEHALSQISYNAPIADATCHLDITVSDLGNNGMPTSYVGSAIGGAENPQPGYEVPDAKGDTQSLTFQVSDSHPDVTIDQLVPGSLGDPAGPNKPSGFRITFSEPIEAASFTVADLDVSASSATGVSLGALVPVVSGLEYTVPVIATGNGTISLTMAAGAAFAAGHNGDADFATEAPSVLDGTITWDQTGPSVTVVPKVGQPNPVPVSPVRFTVTFSDTISTAPIGFTTADLTLSGSAAPTTAQITQPNPLDLSTYEVVVSGMSGAGTVGLSVNSGAIVDTALNPSSQSVTSVVTYSPAPADVVAPTVGIQQAAGQADPTNAASITFTATFSEPVTGFLGSDVSMAGSSTGGTLVATVSGGPTVYTVAVSGMASSGSVVASIPAGAAADGAGNLNTAATTTDNAVQFDNIVPTVTIEKGVFQADPATGGSILFSVVFSEPVTGFATGDVSLGGSAGATTATVDGSGTNYLVIVSGMTSDGTIVASVPAGVAVDSAGNGNASSTSVDNSVDYIHSLEVTTPRGVVTITATGGQLISFSAAPPQVPAPASAIAPYGQLSFSATTAPGSVVTFIIRVPAEVNGYLKLNGTAWASFSYDGQTGARVTGRTVRVFVRDNGRGDADPTPGVVSDPGMPVLNIFGTFQVPGSGFDTDVLSGGVGSPFAGSFGNSFGSTGSSFFGTFESFSNSFGSAAGNAFGAAGSVLALSGGGIAGAVRAALLLIGTGLVLIRYRRSARR